MTQISEADKEFIDYLLKEKQRLWAEVRQEIFEQIGENLHSEYSVPQDIGDYALIDVLEDTGLALSDLHCQKLIRIEDTIRRVRDGRYGFCEDCGQKIAPERLQVAPYTPCCIKCQKKREASEPKTSHTL